MVIPLQTWEEEKQLCGEKSDDGNDRNEARDEEGGDQKLHREKEGPFSETGKLKRMNKDSVNQGS